MAERLLEEERGPGAREVLLAAALLVLLAALAYGSHVANGGFYSDDWANAAGYRFAEAPRYLTAVSEQAEVVGGRPLMTLLLPAPHALFGLDFSAHLALAALLGAAVSLCFFVLLRTLSMPPLHAWAIAALTLLLPWSDSLRLWPAASLNNVAVCLFLLGLTLALRGLDHRGRRGALMHAGADLLYLLSILTYEAAAGTVLLAGLLYLERAPRARALRSWAADIAIVGAGLLYALLATVSERHVGSASERVEDLPAFVREGLLLLSSALQPFGEMGRPLQAAVLLAAGAVAASALLRVRRRGDPAVRRWLRWMLVAVVALAAAYFTFLGSHLHPLDPGIYNRVNLLAGPAICLLVYALVACACELLADRGRAAAGAVVVALLIAAGYGIGLAGDEADWRAAADVQASTLGREEGQLARLPPASRVLEFGVAAATAPEVPVFQRSWGLTGALRIASGGTVEAAYPVYEGISVSCGSRLSIDGGAGYGRFQLDYGRLYFLEPGRPPAQVGSQSDCYRTLSRFRPGPLEL